ncbi:MAG: hypothetical protein HC939_23390 [Pleurocapsa sp. SU_5_0]|nr:hypothetical protein [Pleurocapsa sp. SU_5_0]
MIIFNQNKSKKKILSIIANVISVPVLLILLIQLQNNDLKKSNSIENPDDFQDEKSLATKINIQQKLPSFGFENIVADWNLLKFIQYFGDGETREKVGYSLIPEYFKVIVTKDPHFIKAHLSLSSANSIYAGQPEVTVALLQKAINSMNPGEVSNSSYLWSYKGVDEILFLGDIKAATRSYQKAAEWAMKEGGSMSDITARRNMRTANFLASNPDPTQVQIGAWMTSLSSAKDSKTQNYIIDKIEGLGVEVSITEKGEIKITRPEKV